MELDSRTIEHFDDASQDILFQLHVHNVAPKVIIFAWLENVLICDTWKKTAHLHFVLQNLNILPMSRGINNIMYAHGKNKNTG